MGGVEVHDISRLRHLDVIVNEKFFYITDVAKNIKVDCLLIFSFLFTFQ